MAINWQRLFFSYMHHVDEHEGKDFLHMPSDVDNLIGLAGLNETEAKELRDGLLKYRQEQRKAEGRFE